MSAIKVVHYINQFFAGIGGEELADHEPELRKGALGPGLALAAMLGKEFEIVATIICGDTYFGNNMDAARTRILEMIRGEKPDLFIAGPAFNAGRYGVACGAISVTVENELHIPAITAMYHENPGADMYKKDLYIIATGNSAKDMKPAAESIARLAKKIVKGEEILSPAEEGYLERGIRVNYFHARRGSDRAVDMLLQKLRGEAFTTEYVMPKFDRVPPAKALKDLSKIRIAIVSSGGIVPHGNPDRIESSSATKYGTYSLAGMQRVSKDDFLSIHGGYDRSFILENPNLVIPLDVLRDLEKEGAFGELADYFMTTTGTGTSVGNSQKFGVDMAQKLLDDNVGAVILTST